MCMWVTNRERHLRFIHDELLPHWGLSVVATWYWVKVTNQGELVSPLVNVQSLLARWCMSCTERDCCMSLLTGGLRDF